MQPQDQIQPAPQPAASLTPQPVVVTPTTPQALMQAPNQAFAAPTVSFMPEAQLPVMESPAQPGHRWVTFAVFALLGVILLGAIIGGGYLWMGRQTKQNATTTAEAFIADLNAGNNVKAYQTLTASTRKTETQDQFIQNIGDLSASSPRYTAQNLTVNGKQATYVASEDGLPATSTGRTDGQFTISLVKQGVTGWQVSTVKVE